MHSLLSGLSAYSLDNRYQGFNWGCATSGHDIADTRVYESWRSMLVDMQATAFYANPDPYYNPVMGCVLGGAAVSGDHFAFYLCGHSNGDVAIAAHRGDFYSDVFADLPAGWKVARKLPHEIVWYLTGSPFWQGLPLHHQDRERLWTYLSAQANDATFQILDGQNAPNWTELNLSGWLGYGCRRVRLYYEAIPGNTVGTFYLKTPHMNGSQTVTVVDNYRYGDIELQLSASRKLEYSITGGARVLLYLRAWQNQEMV